MSYYDRRWRRRLRTGLLILLTFFAPLCGLFGLSYLYMFLRTGLAPIQLVPSFKLQRAGFRESQWLLTLHDKSIQNIWGTDLQVPVVLYHGPWKGQADPDDTKPWYQNLFIAQWKSLDKPSADKSLQSFKGKINWLGALKMRAFIEEHDEGTSIDWTYKPLPGSLEIFISGNSTDNEWSYDDLNFLYRRERSFLSYPIFRIDMRAKSFSVLKGDIKLRDFQFEFNSFQKSVSSSSLFNARASQVMIDKMDLKNAVLTSSILDAYTPLYYDSIARIADKISQAIVDQNRDSMRQVFMEIFSVKRWKSLRAESVTFAAQAMMNDLVVAHGVVSPYLPLSIQFEGRTEDLRTIMDKWHLSAQMNDNYGTTTLSWDPDQRLFVAPVAIQRDSAALQGA